MKRTQLYNADDLAAMFKVDRSTITLWYKAGKIPQPFHVGKKIFWTVDEIEKCIKQKRNRQLKLNRKSA